MHVDEDLAAGGENRQDGEGEGGRASAAGSGLSRPRLEEEAGSKPGAEDEAEEEDAPGIAELVVLDTEQESPSDQDHDRPRVGDHLGRGDAAARP